MDAFTAMQRIGGGKLIERIADTIVEISDEVLLTGKKGSVTVTFMVDKSEFSDIGVVASAEIDRKFPKTKAGGSYFYVHEGGLFADDPRQQQMDFHTIEGGAGETHHVEEPKSEIREVGNA